MLVLSLLAFTGLVGICAVARAIVRSRQHRGKLTGQAAFERQRRWLEQQDDDEEEKEEEEGGDGRFIRDPQSDSEAPLL
jgi:hypothetical protein